MEPEQLPQLLAQIALADPRVRREDPIERRAQIHMWAGILADVPYDYALTATHQHYARSTWPVLPADIATRWQATVRDRMERHADPAPPVDPDDEAAYRAELAAARRDVAHGHTPPVTLRELDAGPAAEAEARLAALGSYVPRTVAAELSAFRPRRAERERRATQGLPDPLTVTCPYEPCRAAPGNPCVNHRRHPRTSTHPSRLDAATTAQHATEGAA